MAEHGIVLSCASIGIYMITGIRSGTNGIQTQNKGKKAKKKETR